MFGSMLDAQCSLVQYSSFPASGTNVSCGGSGLNIGSAIGQDTITGIEAYMETDYTFGGTPPNSVQYVFTPSTSGGNTWTESGTGAANGPATSTCTVSSSGAVAGAAVYSCGQEEGLANSTGLTAIATSSDNAAGLQTLGGSGFTIATADTILSGSVGVASNSAVVEYDYTVNSSTPEPATLGLVGSALLGLGFIARKRAAR